MNVTAKDVARFKSKFVRKDDDECWLWTACTDDDGYGIFTLRGKNVKASRFSMALHGTLVGDADCCHSCDTPACVNPKHLFQGTAAENAFDRNNKGRQAKGKRHGRAKLTEDKVLEILKLLSSGSSHKSIVERFGVSYTQVKRIDRREQWKHVSL